MLVRWVACNELTENFKVKYPFLEGVLYPVITCHHFLAALLSIRIDCCLEDS